MVERLEPVPEDGLPPIAVQLKLYGVEPPVAVAEIVRELPRLPEPGPLRETLNGGIVVEMLTVEVAVAILPVESVALTLTVNVPVFV